MLKAIVLGLLIVFSVTSVQSQQPPPSARKTTSKNQQVPANQEKAPNDDKRGTKDAPVIIEMTNPPNGDAIATKIKKNREDQTAENWRALVFNSLLVVVGILQVVALIYTALVTNKAANAEKAAAEHIPRIERAYVFIEPLMEGGSVKYLFYNHGKTPAVVLSLGATSEITASPPDNSKHFSNITIADKYVLPPGPDEAWTNYKKVGITDVHRELLRSGNAFVWFWGSLRYEDVFGKEHFTYFRGKYDGRTNDFVADGDAPHNKRT